MACNPYNLHADFGVKLLTMALFPWKTRWKYLVRLVKPLSTQGEDTGIPEHFAKDAKGINKMQKRND